MRCNTVFKFWRCFVDRKSSHDQLKLQFCGKYVILRMLDNSWQNQHSALKICIISTLIFSFELLHFLMKRCKHFSMLLLDKCNPGFIIILNGIRVVIFGVCRRILIECRRRWICCCCRGWWGRAYWFSSKVISGFTTAWHLSQLKTQNNF